MAEHWKLFHTSKTGGPHRKAERERYWYISDQGNVKVLNNYNDEIRNPSVSLTGGHPGSRYAALSKNDMCSKYIHRLVAMYFCHNPFNEINRRITVDHLDGNKMNNHYTNLEWVTNSENNLRWRMRKRLGIWEPSSQELETFSNREEVNKIILDLYDEGLSTTSIQKRLGLTQSRVWNPVKLYRIELGLFGTGKPHNETISK